MKNLFAFITITSVLVLTACSQSEDPALVSNPQQFIEAAGLLEVISGSGEFGEVTASKLANFTIRNTGDAVSEVPTPSIIGEDAAAFALIYQSGCVIALKKNANCSVRIQFNPSGKDPGIYLATLKVGTTLEIPLTAEIPSPPAATYGLFEGAVELESLNLGTLTNSQSVTKILTLKNTGAVSSPILNMALSNNNFSLSSNTCSGKPLAVGKSCTFRLLFSASGKSAQTYLSDLLFGDIVFALSASVSSPPTPGAPESGVVFETYVNNEPLSAAEANLGLLPNNQGIVKIITVKNVGSATSQPFTLAINENDNFILISNTCVNKILAPQASCSTRLAFSALNKEAGLYNASLTFGTAVVEIESEVLPTADCPVNTHLEAPVCMNDVQPCAYANGTGNKIWNGSGYDACFPIACNEGYDLANNSCLTSCASGDHRDPVSFLCEPDIIDCVEEIEHATIAQKTWNGSNAYGSCLVSACESGFVVEGNLCAPEGQPAIFVAGTTYRLQKKASVNKVQIINTANSAVVLDEIGDFVDDENNTQVCQATLLNLLLPATATLTVDDSCKSVVLKVQGNMTIDGNILARSSTVLNGTYLAVDAFNQLQSRTYVQASGGSGAGGGQSWTASIGSAGQSVGGAELNGGGGGGGGGNASWWYGCSRLGGSGGSARSGGGGGSLANCSDQSNVGPVYGGNGGSGGSYGLHGNNLYIKVSGTFEGSGTINASGVNGSNGSGGGNPYCDTAWQVSSGGGGGGGGGAGGNAGNILIAHHALGSSYPTLLANAGSGGSGAGGGGGCSGNGGAGQGGGTGSSGQPGSAGVIELSPF